MARGVIMGYPSGSGPVKPLAPHPEPGIWRPGACRDCHTEDDVDTLNRCLYCSDLHGLTTTPIPSAALRPDAEPAADISSYMMTTIRG